MIRSKFWNSCLYPEQEVKVVIMKLWFLLEMDAKGGVTKDPHPETGLAFSSW